MRVLFVSHYADFGGPHNYGLQLHKPLAARGWEITFALPDYPGNAAERLRSGGVSVIQMPLHRLRRKLNPSAHLAFAIHFAREVRALRKLISEKEIGLVVVFELLNPHAAIAARLEGVPVVWALVDVFPPMPVRRLVMPMVTRLADVLMSTGKQVAEAHPGATGFGDRLVPFLPPVDVENFRPDPARRRAAREELSIQEGDLVVGNVSNINPKKDHGTFIRAAAILRRKCQGVRFVILGATLEGHEKYMAQLWREAESLGLRLGQDLIVRNPGARVALLAQALDIFWLTSWTEGIPTVVAEAMALKLPVVTTDVGSVRELVQDGISAFVVRPRDPQAVADATGPLAEIPSLRVRLGEAARRHVVRHCAIGVCVDTYASAFEKAVANGLVHGKVA